MKTSLTVVLRHKIKQFNKSINVDPDKSLSIRSFLIGSISQGISTASNILESEDVKNTITVCKKLGVKIKKIKPKIYRIYGNGLGSLYLKKQTELNFGNSGTASRLMIGILSTTPNIQVRIKGDHSLNKRSMGKLIDLMEKFGAYFFPKNKNNFPLKMISSEMPIGINYNAGISAQLKSAVILAGLNSFGITTIAEKIQSRDHTEKMILKNSNSLNIKKGKKRIIKVKGKSFLNTLKFNVPGDPSSAAFFAALTILKSNSSLKIKDVGLNPKRIGFYEILKKAGAKIKFKNIKNKKNEIFGDILIKSSKINPLKTSKKYYVTATDEYPIMFVMAGLTPGISIFKGIEDLANKESNRIKEMQKILYQIGVKSKFSKNQLKIFGKKINNNKKKTINVANLGDHRICQSAAILSLVTGIKAKIKNFETVNTSAPSFLKIIKSLGGKFEIKS